MVGPDHLGVLRRHRGHRPGPVQTRQEWLAHPGTVGPADARGRSTSSATTATSCPTGAAGHDLLRGRGRTSSTATTRRRPRRPTTPEGGARSATSATSTTTGSSYLTDRKAYMIISGGVNIYPQEAENLLITHPKVADVAVFGVPNDDFGEEVKAVVQPPPGRRAGAGARAGADRLLPRPPGRLQVPAQRSTSRPSCPAIPPASSTSACSTATGKVTRHRSSDVAPNSVSAPLQAAALPAEI